MLDEKMRPPAMRFISARSRVFLAGWIALCVATSPLAQLTAESRPAHDAVSLQTQTEAHLRKRVSLFYDCYVTGEFRTAERYVAIESRDVFYNLAKEPIRSYRIASVTFEDGGRAAKVMLVISNQTLLGGRLVMANMPLTANWKYTDSEWYWSAPARTASRLPMGPVVDTGVQLKAAPANLADINERAQRLPRSLAGLGAPLLDKPVLTLDQDTGFQDVTHLRNQSTQPLRFEIDWSGSSGVAFIPSQADLPAGKSVEIMAKAVQAPGELRASKQEGHILVHSGTGSTSVTIQFYVAVLTR